MSKAAIGPITHLSWGRIEVTLGGRVHTFKDCKVWPEGAGEWDWKLTGTRHVPGTQPADIKELLERRLEWIVLSRGIQLALGTAPKPRSSCA